MILINKSKFLEYNADRYRIYTAAFLRASATGLLGVLLGVYLADLKLDSLAVGFIIGAGLAGGALAALIVTLTGDRIGRRFRLIFIAVLTSVIGLGAALTSSPILLSFISFFGMLNGMGRDRSASLILEQAILPSTVSPQQRTQAFAWYNVLQDAGHAIGGLLVGIPALLPAALGLVGLPGYRTLLVIYALMNAATIIMYLGLSSKVEAENLNSRQALPKQRITKETKRVVWKISSLFFIDSLGGGFLTTALLSYFFFQRFDVSLSEIGILFFGARALNALSHFGAAWLAKHIGLVNTMVFTHIPSSLLLITVAFAPSFWIASILFLLREGLVEMDVPTRQSYVMAVVKPDERIFASSVTNLVRMGGWAIAPSFAGMMMSGMALMVPLIIGAGLKIGYDIALWANFRKVKPPEER